MLYFTNEFLLRLNSCFFNRIVSAASGVINDEQALHATVVHIQLEHLLLDHAASDERVFTAAWFIWPAMHQPQHNCRRPAQTIHWNAQQLVTAQTVYVSRSDLVNDENTCGRKGDTFTANIHGLYLPDGGQGVRPPCLQCLTLHKQVQGASI